MPLKEGSSSEVVGWNIKKLVDEGRPRRQAIAIALSTSRRERKRKAVKDVSRT